MNRLLRWIWRKGLVSTFMAGFFVILPIAITLGIMGYMGSLLKTWLGADSPLGSLLQRVGLNYVTNAMLASVIGWITVLLAIWILGAIVKSAARYRFETFVHQSLNQIPVISSIYGPVSKVVGMLKRDEGSEMQSMSVVFCEFGAEHGGGFLALLSSEKIYHFGGRDCYIVYIPTSPIPMSGGIVFVPIDMVQHVDMEVEHLMQIYLSLGVMSEVVIPEKYIQPEIAVPVHTSEGPAKV
ncbi:MAG: DUF502 domain-containing protein, partial [Pirellulaceae bacterium]